MSTQSTPAPALAADCPECSAAVAFARAPRRHEVCRCSGCGVELEVAAVEPLTLEVAPEVEEDWGE